tara:strand:+ start:944 stop:1243 length:300 start_codon:yes stop_codon:yes gene_type:complete
MRKHGKVDLNQHEIVRTLRQYPGVTVQSLASVGSGVPDLILGFRGATLLIEVKGRKGTLTNDQQAWHDNWEGAPVAVIRSPDEALALLKTVEHFQRKGG